MTPRTCDRKLLVLDLDETLIHASEQPLGQPEDFRVGPYFVYRRPHLEHFIGQVARHFELAVWTSSGEGYAAQVVERISPAGLLRFVWASRRCTMARDFTTGGYTSIKNLAKLKRHGWRLEAVLAVDDTPSKHARNYGNLVTVREFNGEHDDAELPLLAAYLAGLAEVDNVRAIEKRGWRDRLQRAPGLHVPRTDLA